MRLIQYLFLAGAFLGPYAYIGYEKLHLIRIVSPLLLAIFAFIYRVQLSRSSTFLIVFYSVYVTYTMVISLLHLSYIDPNGIFNLLVLLVFVVVIIVTIQFDKDLFLMRLINICWLFVFVSIPILCFEVVTQRHLPYSGMANTLRHDYTYFHLPTVFYSNPNDFAFIYVLITMFLLYHERRAWVGYLLVIISLAVIYITESRLAFVCFVIYLLFYFNFLRLKTLVILSLLAILIFLPIYQTGEFSPDKLFNFDISHGSSISRRYHLFLGGLNSVFYNYGTGFGVEGYHYYYTHIFPSKEILSDTDPHNFVIELLINSGIYITICYILLNIAILIGIIRQGASRLLVAQFVLYNFLLLSSSSSLFLWPHYLFFFTYLFYQDETRTGLSNKGSELS